MTRLSGKDLVGLILILMNILGILLWGWIKPSVLYEQVALERFEAAKASNVRGDSVAAFLQFDEVATRFPQSTIAERALFMSGRTALRSLGRFDLAKPRFKEYLALFPSGSYNKRCRSYLDLIGCVDDLPPYLSSTILWEIVQAEVEHEHGADFEALNRCENIIRRFPASKAAEHAGELKKQIPET